MITKKNVNKTIKGVNKYADKPAEKRIVIVSVWLVLSLAIAAVFFARLYINKNDIHAKKISKYTKERDSINEAYSISILKCQEKRIEEAIKTAKKWEQKFEVLNRKVKEATSDQRKIEKKQRVLENELNTFE